MPQSKGKNVEYLKNPTKKQLNDLEKNVIGFTITNNGDLYTYVLDEEKHKRFAKHFLSPEILNQKLMSGDARRVGNTFTAYVIRDALRVLDRVNIGVVGSLKRAKEFFKKADAISNKINDKIKIDEYLSDYKGRFRRVRANIYGGATRRQPRTADGVRRKIRKLEKESKKLPMKRLKLR